VFHRLGCRPVINACGIYTDLGGTVLSPTVWAAMEQANHAQVSMVELLDASGSIVAVLLGTEAARIAPGASACITLATAACMAGADGEKAEQLPNAEGMNSEVAIQRRHRYKYDRMARIAGAKLVEVGDDVRTTPAELDAALGAGTAAMCFPAHLDGLEGTVSLDESISIAHAKGIPVIVDAAYLNYPVELMSGFTRRGADLVIFSAKYFYGPNAGGVVCGRSDLIEAVAALDFTRFESGDYLPLGRPFKQDRQTVVGVVTALQEWLTMDHRERFAGYSRRVATIASQIEDAPGISCTPMHLTMRETLRPEPVNCLHVEFGPYAARGAAEVEAALAAGDPAIALHLREGEIIVDVECVSDDDARVIGSRLRQELGLPMLS
jgi:L-seryl-tRNA(Ser) seleniumtransferase